MKIQKGLIIFICLILTNIIAIYYLLNILLFIISIAFLLRAHYYPYSNIDIKFIGLKPLITNFNIDMQSNLFIILNNIYRFFNYSILNNDSIIFQRNRYTPNTTIFFEEEQFKSLLFKIFIIFLVLISDIYIFILLY